MFPYYSYMTPDNSQNKTILHIDFDSFFASVTQQHHKELRGKPIGITASNSRTCIIACSKEAKKFGIKNGVSSYAAFRLCPKLQLVPADFTKYWEISKNFINICKDYSPYVEVFSIDELFMDVTQTAHLFGGTSLLIKQIKTRIKDEIGEYITVSVGVSHNKLLAKLASDLKKPDGVCVITEQNLDRVYKSIKLTDMCGIGSRITQRLNTMGITTLLKLRKVPLPYLVAEFGEVEAVFLHNTAFGIDYSEVMSYSTVLKVKSVSRNYCLPKNEYNKRVVLQNIDELCEEVALKLRRLNKVARTVGFSFSGSTSFKARKTYQRPFDRGHDMFLYIRSLLNKDEFLKDNNYIRQICVWTSNLQEKKLTPLSLFTFDQKQEKVLKTVDYLNDKFGHHTVRNGFLLYSEKLTTVPNGYLADKYERIKLAKTE